MFGVIRLFGAVETVEKRSSFFVYKFYISELFSSYHAAQDADVSVYEAEHQLFAVARLSVFCRNFVAVGLFHD